MWRLAGGPWRTGVGATRDTARCIPANVSTTPYERQAVKRLVRGPSFDILVTVLLYDHRPLPGSGLKNQADPTGVVQARVGQIVTFFAYRPPSRAPWAS